jgi:hypothetical protein
VLPANDRPRAIEPVEARPWGAVLRVTTPTRTAYFKAVGPRARHETWLLADIGARHPGLAPDVLSVDHAAGWVLMADHGGPMHGVLDQAEQVRVVESLLPAYAEMQRTTIDLLDRWREVGVPDRSPGRMPARLEELLAGHGTSGPIPVEANEIALYVDELGRFTDACAALGARAAIDHADIHGWNVFVAGDDARIADWGDACITHPCSSLHVPIEWIVARLPPADHVHAVERLRDAYVEGWGSGIDRAELAAAFWVAYVARALSNDEQSLGAGPEDLGGMQREIVMMLRTWYRKRSLLASPDEMLLPALRW